MNIHFLQHVPFEGLASIRSWIEHGGHKVTCTRLYAGDGFPRPDNIDLLIVMGGPMGVYDIDQYPWLTAEKTFIRAVIDAGKRVLGICLGAQLIADVLGGRVYPNGQKEIGWFPITRTTAAETSALGRLLPAEFVAYHWHGDTFELPPGAVHLAQTPVCRHQAYAIGDRILGLQFHLETTPESARELIEHGGDELVGGPTIQSAEAMLADNTRFVELNRLMFALLDGLTAAD
ncbi:MAG: gamma-glutamyl-gamma-aminobutyrate hydrolase family protein [Gammaproteobacteria bacterium]|nr:gamma-glutamyl-gamma-aminobutyrate hydrolase family protein [Gammaproteobacteria bacterium]